MSSKTEKPHVPHGYRIVDISRQPIELYKIIKFESIAISGGEAKTAVAMGDVLLNGVVETQKRKKIVAGDRIEIGDEKLFIRFSPEPDSANSLAEKTKPSAPKQKHQPRAAIPISKRN